MRNIISCAHISKGKICFNVKSSTYILISKQRYWQIFKSALCTFKINTMVSKKWICHKERSVASNYFIILKILFQFKNLKELIWGTNYPNIHIITFCKRWSLIGRCFLSLWVSLIEKLDEIATSHCQKINCSFVRQILTNPFHSTDPFWYLLKTSENLWFSDDFRGYLKRSVAWNGLTVFPLVQMFLPARMHSVFW